MEDPNKLEFLKLVELFKLDGIKAFASLGRFDNSIRDHRSLLLSVYCAVSKEVDWPEEQSKWKILGFENTDNIIIEINSEFSLIMLFGILYYANRYSEARYFFFEGKQLNICNLMKISEVLVTMIKREIITEVYELFFIFVALAEVLEDAINKSIEGMIQEVEELKKKYLIRKIQF